MRLPLAVASLALVMMAVPAHAQDLPVDPDVTVRPILPPDCGARCGGAVADASLAITNCYDCPAAATHAGAYYDGGRIQMSAWACAGAYVWYCPVDMRS